MNHRLTAKYNMHTDSKPSSVQSGFTLIELLVVVAIIAILVKIAVPSYNTMVMESHRSDAKAALLDLSTREEKYFSVNNQYTNDPTQLYSASSTFPLAVQSSTSSYYQLNVSSVSSATSSAAATYTATAAPTGGQTNDACGTYIISNTGVTSNASGTMTSGCW